MPVLLPPVVSLRWPVWGGLNWEAGEQEARPCVRKVPRGAGKTPRHLPTIGFLIKSFVRNTYLVIQLYLVFIHSSWNTLLMGKWDGASLL